MAATIYSTGSLHPPPSCFLQIEPAFGAVVVCLGVAAGLAVIGSARIRRAAIPQATRARPLAASWA